MKEDQRWWNKGPQGGKAILEMHSSTKPHKNAINGTEAMVKVVCIVNLQAGDSPHIAPSPYNNTVYQ